MVKKGVHGQLLILFIRPRVATHKVFSFVPLRLSYLLHPMLPSAHTHVSLPCPPSLPHHAFPHIFLLLISLSPESTVAASVSQTLLMPLSS